MFPTESNLDELDLQLLLAKVEIDHCNPVCKAIDSKLICSLLSLHCNFAMANCCNAMKQKSTMYKVALACKSTPMSQPGSNHDNDNDNNDNSSSGNGGGQRYGDNSCSRGNKKKKEEGNLFRGGAGSSGWFYVGGSRVKEERECGA